ncbi:MAG: hypothetical protein ACTSQG_00555 [Promethearchaeota archaeon]
MTLNLLNVIKRIFNKKEDNISLTREEWEQMREFRKTPIRKKYIELLKIEENFVFNEAINLLYRKGE